MADNLLQDFNYLSYYTATNYSVLKEVIDPKRMSRSVIWGTSDLVEKPEGNRGF
jgi:hypothetical protein